MKLIARFLKDRSAATAIEYGLIAGALALAIVVSVNSVGTKISGVLTTVSTSLK
jgi:pilus assembly protein Flp/PilA